MKSNKKNRSTTFKYNDIDDKDIYDVLENKVIDKSQFIKNALYYYIQKVESGEIIDRNFPQKKQKEYNQDETLNMLMRLLNIKNNTQEDIEKNTNEETIENKNNTIKQDIIIPTELSGVSEDDFDF